MKNFLSNAMNSVNSATKSATDVYDKYIREKAMKVVNEKLEQTGLNLEDIDLKDYEAMVSDASKDIQSNYNKKIAQVGLSALGLDLLFGL